MAHWGLIDSKHSTSCRHAEQGGHNDHSPSSCLAEPDKQADSCHTAVCMTIPMLLPCCLAQAQSTTGRCTQANQKLLGTCLESGWAASQHAMLLWHLRYAHKVFYSIQQVHTGGQFEARMMCKLAQRELTGVQYKRGAKGPSASPLQGCKLFAA